MRAKKGRPKKRPAMEQENPKEGDKKPWTPRLTKGRKAEPDKDSNLDSPEPADFRDAPAAPAAFSHASSTTAADSVSRHPSHLPEGAHCAWPG